MSCFGDVFVLVLEIMCLRRESMRVFVLEIMCLRRESMRERPRCTRCYVDVVVSCQYNLTQENTLKRKM